MRYMYTVYEYTSSSICNSLCQNFVDVYCIIDVALTDSTLLYYTSILYILVGMYSYSTVHIPHLKY